MKKRNRKTGEIVDIIAFSQWVNRDASDYVSYIDSKGVEHDTENGLNYYWDFEPVDDSTSNIDWEQRRYEIAKAAMQGVLAGSVENARKWANHNEIHDTMQNIVSKYAISCADALINKLK